MSFQMFKAFEATATTGNWAGMGFERIWVDVRHRAAASAAHDAGGRMYIGGRCDFC